MNKLFKYIFFHSFAPAWGLGYCDEYCCCFPGNLLMHSNKILDWFFSELPTKNILSLVAMNYLVSAKQQKVMNASFHWRFASVYLGMHFRLWDKFSRVAFCVKFQGKYANKLLHSFTSSFHCACVCVCLSFNELKNKSKYSCLICALVRASMPRRFSRSTCARFLCEFGDRRVLIRPIRQEEFFLSCKEACKFIVVTLISTLRHLAIKIKHKKRIYFSWNHLCGCGYLITRATASAQKNGIPARRPLATSKSRKRVTKAETYFYTQLLVSLTHKWTVIMQNWYWPSQLFTNCTGASRRSTWETRWLRARRERWNLRRM